MYGDKKLLLIMRHAKSDRTIPDMTDFDRPLNKRGQGEPKIIANNLNKLNLEIEKAVVSSSQRTVETWNLLKKKLDKPPKVSFEKKLYNANFQDVIDVLIDEAPQCKGLLIIGHNPSVSEVCEFLTGENHEFRPASLAILSAKDTSLGASLKKPGHFHLEQIFSAT